MRLVELRALLLILSLPLLTCRTKGIDTSIQQEKKVAISQQLLEKAEEVVDTDYENLRNRFLEIMDSPDQEVVSALSAKGWRQSVMLRAWKEWLRDREACRQLWDYYPPSNQYRNPFPLMEKQTVEYFSQRGETGHILALELLLKKTKGAQRFFHTYVARRNMNHSLDVLLDCTVGERNPPHPRVLSFYGREAPAKFLASFTEAQFPGKTILAWALSETGYRQCVPKLGEVLMKIPKEGYNDRYKFSFYWAEEEDLGLAITAALEKFSGQKFYGWRSSGGTGESYARRIDACKRWWEEQGQYMDWGPHQFRE